MIENFGELEKIVSLAQRRNCEFAEAREIQKSLTTVTVIGKDFKKFNFNEKGYNFRIIKKGRLSFNFSEKLDKLEEMAEIETRKVSEVRHSYKLAETDQKPTTLNIDSEYIEKTPLEEFRKVLCGSYVSTRRAKCIFGVIDNLRRHAYVNSEHFQLRSTTNHLFLTITVLPKSRKYILSEAIPMMSTSDINEDLISENTEALIKEAEVFSSAKTIKPQKTISVVLSPQIAASFIHELVHQLEADIVLKGKSDLVQRSSFGLNQSLTVIDTAGKKDFGWRYSYDDEGVKKRGTVLIEKGKVRNFLQNRETAARSGEALTGNAYVHGYKFLPIVAQRFIEVKKGDHSFHEILEEIGEGLYLFRPPQVDIAKYDGKEIMIKILHGYQIRNGTLARPVKNIVVKTNNISETLSNLVVFSKERETVFVSCGKYGREYIIGVLAPYVATKFNVRPAGGLSVIPPTLRL